MDLPHAASFAGLGLSAELAMILALVLLNGVFAGAELAILTLRKGQLEGLLQKSPRRARPIATLRRQPDLTHSSSSNLVLRPFHDRATFSEPRLSPDELRQLVEEAALSGELDEHSGEIASRALELAGLTAADLMVPRNRIDAIARDAAPDKIKQLLLESGHSRMPVYEGAIDNVIDDILRPPLFLLQSLQAHSVLRELQSHRSGLAFVADEHGELLGLLTMEDVIEELVGEIITENERREAMQVRESGGAARIRGDALIREINRQLPASLPEYDRWSTVAGLCTGLAERIPQNDVCLKTDNGWRIEILDASPRRVRLVHISRDDDGTSEVVLVADAGNSIGYTASGR